ncbi:hypothetical protein Cgig2_025127 [Carnegiea gigantea]|uniref:tRNA(adenine(34)) deaminase n=1 Tax=Carnegiea gigantea TaxID=171969 RepID=A0A9Q1KSS2_9CARY|nr:hypothetical protein Cgig2_025127 [Carnegiea gigantea]
MNKVEVNRGRVQPREKAHMRGEELKAFLRDDDRRRESSSSYHMSSHLGDFESDTEVQIKRGGFVGESSFKHEKDSMRTGGIVIREEMQQGSRIYRDQQLESSIHDDSKVGNSTEWDCRKKLEKKLTEESDHETKSNRVSVVRQSQSSHAHESNSVKALCSKKQLNYQEAESGSGASFHEQSNTHIKIDNRASEYLKSSATHEELMQANRNEVKSTSDTLRISEEEESVMAVAKSAQEAGCEYCEECGGIMKLSKTGTDFQQHAEISETRGDASLSLVAQSQSESRLINQENSSTSLHSSVTEASNVDNKSESRFKMQEKSSNSCKTLLKGERKQHHQVIHAADGEVNTETKSQQHSGTVASHGEYAESTLRLQNQSETRMKNMEEYSTSLVSRREVKGLQEESSGEVIKEFECNKESQTGLHASQVHSTNVETNRQLVSDERIYSEQTHLTSVEKIVEKHNQVNETNVRLVLRAEKQGHLLQTGFTGNSSGDSAVTQPSLTLISQTGVEQVNDGEVNSDLQLSIVFPSYKCAEGRSPYAEPPTSSVSNDHVSITGIGTSVACVQPQARPDSSSLEADSDERKPFKEPSTEDALDSAEHMESLQIVGEFVERMSHEVSASDTKMEKKLSQRNSRFQDEKYLLNRSSQSASKKISFQKQDVGGFEVQTSPVKSGDRSLFNGSASGETGFSKNEPDDASVDNLEKRETSMPQKPATSDQIPPGRNGTRTQKENLVVVGSNDNTGPAAVGASSSSSVLQSGLLLGVISIGANSNFDITQKMPQFNPSLNLFVNPSRQPRGSHTSEEIEEVCRIEGVVSSAGELKEHSIDVTQTGVSASDITDVDLKQRKLQRSDQVLQETFDKWENAYRLENEQRKIDEFFMREALVEAKKAADSWEVPVGAVLVQNGKIIARGYNLVEELRDPTAHAEIFCIREGSSVLQTWRLSETTLYVTLEPCPMCAGAILQARIDTLVWGAPNKLLGADGSWIRLFPEGAEREQRPEVAEKPAAPVHPFHPKIKIRRGLLQSECADIMQQFFRLRRRKKQKQKSEEPSQPSCLPIPHHTSKLLHKMLDILRIMFCM